MALAHQQARQIAQAVLDVDDVGRLTNPLGVQAFQRGRRLLERVRAPPGHYDRRLGVVV
jgi:hypothetical protein